MDMYNSKSESECVNESSFARAGFFSRMSFWWLNPLMKKGKKKTLDDDDIPMLRKEDRAETCYLLFMEHLMKQKQPKPSILSAMFSCYWKGILISGFFALIKIITLSAGPLFLSAFIKVAEGKESFKHEGYVLAILLLFVKCLESLSQRQWYFRSKLMGVQIRSLLSAAIYSKQLKLSNAVKNMHSAGQIVNYVTVDAYRVGEFAYWLHQTWTTSLQICIILGILVNSVGLATLAALVVIVLTMLCNIPLAKLHHKFHSKLMAAQDVRLKTMSEALVNMKVLKLYAWETHFKIVIEGLRSLEYKWLLAVQLRKACIGYLFWVSPVLVMVATFWTCYFLNIPLNASKVFTFVATLRLVQDPVRSIPEVIEVIIQSNIALTRIAEFLSAPELQSANAKQKINLEELTHSIFIKSSDLSWEENPSKPTLRNITLEVKPGEKVAICGEVGAGKSTLLAAILGEVPSVRGNEYVMGALLGKTVLLVTHQVDFLPAFDYVMLMSDGEVLCAAPYHMILASSQEFFGLVNAHKDTAGTERC